MHDDSVFTDYVSSALESQRSQLKSSGIRLCETLASWIQWVLIKLSCTFLNGVVPFTELSEPKSGGRCVNVDKFHARNNFL